MEYAVYCLQRALARLTGEEIEKVIGACGADTQLLLNVFAGAPISKALAAELGDKIVRALEEK